MKIQRRALYYPLGLILFFIVLWYNIRYFAFNYPYIEQMDIFLYNQDYACERIFKTGGLMSYISVFINQFYLYPYWGAAIASAVFVATVIGTNGIWRKIAPQLFVPLFILLPGITLLWAQADFNYHWSGTWAVLFALLAINVYIRINSLKLRVLLMMVLSWLGYYISGPAMFIAVISAIVYDIFNGKERLRWFSLVNLPWSMALPYLIYKSGEFGNLSDAFSFDMYYHSHLASTSLHYYAAVAVFLNIAMAVILRNIRPVKSARLFTASIVLQILLAGYVLHSGAVKYNPEQNYYAKQLDYYTRTGQWNEILDFRELRAGQNFMHTCYQNLALSELGMLGNKLFKYRQAGPRGLVIPWNQSVSSSMLLSDVFYKMGNIALAQEMAFEGLVGTESSMNPRMLMRLVQTNLIMGYIEVAGKYISILKETAFYKDKAIYYSRFVENPELIDKDPELGGLRKCIDNTSGLINSGTFTDGLYKIISRNPEYTPSLEYYGAMCLLSKNIQAFTVLADVYLNSGKPMPSYFQEAYIMMHEGESEEQWRNYGISEEVISRFKNYCSDVLALRKKGGNTAFALKNKYADTYWFYFMFAK